MKTFTEVFNYQDKAIILTSNELFYLRLFAHNYDDDAIAKFLNISKEALSIAKFGIKEKFNEINWINIIKKAQDLHILDPMDYVPDFIEREAQLCVNNLVSVSNRYSNEHVLGHLQNTLMEFYKAIRMIGNYRQGKLKAFRTLTDLEKKYLVLKYSGFNEVTIIQSLNISAKEVFKLKRQVLNKLGTNSLFNAYRIAVDTRLIKKHTVTSKVLMQSSIDIAQSIHNLNSALVNKPQKNQKAYTQALYYKMLEFYNRLHYAVLFNNSELSLN